MVQHPLSLSVDDETLQNLRRWSTEFDRGQKFLLKEVVQIDLPNRRLHYFVEPSPQFC